jgi:uncharacterized membrane protein
MWKHPLFWLTLMVIGFFAVSVYAGIAAFDNLSTHNSGDAGLITQAVASTTFGRQAPFYESYDCMFKDRCSFMLVHPGFVLVMATPFYALAPSTVTLFALRSVFVAAAAAPLYWLTRQVTQSQAKGVLAAGLYLVWAPTLAGDAFSLHLESLLPVELLTLAALWQAGRYRWGLLVALTAFLTLEIAPVFVFLIGLFFLLPFAERWARRRWIRFRRGAQLGPWVDPKKTTWSESVRMALKSRELRYTLLLMGSSAVALVVLFTFMNVWGYLALGVSPHAVPPGLSGLFYDGSTGPTHSYTLVSLLHSSQTAYSADYWFILYALLAFIPLLSPRSLVISVPWIVWTFRNDSSRFTLIGHQYTMIAAVPLFIGLAYGLRRIPFGRPRSTTPGPTPTGSSVSVSVSAMPRRRRWRSRAVSYSMVSILAVIVVANVVFSPIDPLLPDIGYQLPHGFAGLYFHNLTITPGLAWAEQLVSNIPWSATVAAESVLFPLVANYPYAMDVEPNIQPFADPQETANLPFSLHLGPEFVLLPLSFFPSLKSAFSQNLSNPNLYRLRGYVASTAIGPLLLYEQSYTGTAVLYGPPLTELNSSYWPGHGLFPGPIGRTVKSPSAPTGEMVRSNPGVTVTGEVWTGPRTFLAPGGYTLRVEASATGSGLKTNPLQPVFGLIVRGFGVTVLNETFLPSTFVSGEWTNLTVNFTTSVPVPETVVQGLLLGHDEAIWAAYLTVQPRASG